MCRMSWKSWSLNLLEISGLHRACNGTTLPCVMFTLNTDYFAKHLSLIGLYNGVVTVKKGLNFYVEYVLGKIYFWKGSTQLAQIRKKCVSFPARAGIIEPSERHSRFEKPCGLSFPLFQTIQSMTSFVHRFSIMKSSSQLRTVLLLLLYACPSFSQVSTINVLIRCLFNDAFSYSG
jgi:hypothetical protein